MKASTLYKKLGSMIEKHGDRDFVFVQNGSGVVTTGITILLSEKDYYEENFFGGQAFAKPCFVLDTKN